MSSSVLVALVPIVLWTVACGVLVARLYSRRGDGRLEHDQFLTLVAVVSLAAAPWVSLIVYLTGDRQTVLGGVINVVVAAAVWLAALRARKARLQTGSVRESQGSFRQKSALLMVCTLALTYIAYAVLTWRVPVLIIPLFFGSALLVAIVAGVGHAVIALAHAPSSELDEAEDERDRDAERAGSRVAYLVLAFGIWVVPVVALLQWPALVVTNLAFLFIVLAQIAKYAAVVRYYRYGGAR
jgi:hypothetical protein